MKKLAIVILLATVQLYSHAQSTGNTIAEGYKNVLHDTWGKIKNPFGKKHKDDADTSNKTARTDKATNSNGEAFVKNQIENLNKVYALKSKDYSGAEKTLIMGQAGSYIKFKDKKCGGINYGWDADELAIKGAKDVQGIFKVVMNLIRAWADENAIVVVDNNEIIAGEQTFELSKNNLSQGYIAVEQASNGVDLKSVRLFLNDSKYDKDVVISAGNNTPKSIETSPSTQNNFTKDEENLNKIFALKVKDYKDVEKEKFNSILGEKGMYVLVTKEMGGFYSVSWNLRESKAWAANNSKPQTLVDAHKLILQWAAHNGITVSDNNFVDAETGHQYSLMKDKKVGFFALKYNAKNELIGVTLILNDSKYAF